MGGDSNCVSKSWDYPPGSPDDPSSQVLALHRNFLSAAWSHKVGVHAGVGIPGIPVDS